MKSWLNWLVMLLLLVAGGWFAIRVSTARNNGACLRYFRYGGYGDSKYSTLNGEVLTLKNGKLVPLPGVLVDGAPGTLSDVPTDSSGHVVQEYSNGNFDIELYKKGYRMVRFKNYAARPDQVAFFSVVLIQGYEDDVIVIDVSGSDDEE